MTFADCILRWQLRDGSHDWNYPWDLCGTLYRTSEALTQVQAIAKRFGEGALGHPNRLEQQGAAVAEARLGCFAATARECACFAQPALVVVTVNRVQEVFSNRVFGSATACDVDVLDKALQRGDELDEGVYGAIDYPSVHVGGLHWRHTAAAAAALELASAAAKPTVSVLMPVHNGEHTVVAAVDSILHQSVAALELIIVDDGSTDGTAALLKAIAKHDARVRLISNSRNLGVAASLNAGTSC